MSLERGTCHAYLLKRVRDAVKINRCGMLLESVLLFQHNAPARNSHVAQIDTSSSRHETLRHPSDLGPSNLHHFLHMNLFLESRQFPDYDTLIAVVESWLQGQPEDVYKNGIRSYVKQWQKCVALGGSYVAKGKQICQLSCLSPTGSGSGQTFI